MCGIGGILFSNEQKDQLKRKIELLNHLQYHRGPDEQKILISGCHALCHQRLSLIDSEGGKQPFFDESGRYVLVYNGEIYNFRELKKELLTKYSFKTHSDTEVILAAYLTWGIKCLDYFNGMFSFFIWDTVKEEGFAARDPLGVKPFVYSYQNHTFYFSSELKSLVAILDQSAEVDPYQLMEYIIAPSLSGAGEQSILKDIFYLEPGTYLEIKRSGLHIKKYYTFSWLCSNQSEKELIHTMDDSLEKSVEQSLVSDVPLGIFLSGGLDSSLIASIAAKHSVNPLKAYTICFQDHQTMTFDQATIVNSDDFPYAEELATLLNFDFVKVESIFNDLNQSLRQLAEINDRIPVWEQEFSQNFLSQSASKDTKAVFVGDAADELNFGYFFLLNPLVNQSPWGLINYIGGTRRLDLLSSEIKKKYDPSTYFNEKYTQIASNAGYDFKKGGEESILAMSTLIQQRWLTRLLHNGDICTMHHGLEARVPFANRNFLEIASQIPVNYGFSNTTEKKVLRHIASRWLPEKFSLRKKSSLPRDPRLGVFYQEILLDLLKEKNDFIDFFLDKRVLLDLCHLCPILETDRVLLFHMICLIHWSKIYVK